MFDLDGTLADTLRDLTEAGNAMCAAFGGQPRTAEEYRYLVGQGAPWLAQHALALPAGDPRIEPAARHFRQTLLEAGHPHAVPYEGVEPMLDELTRRRLTLAVLSNKPEDSTLDMVDRVFGRERFAHVRGHREGAAPKPDPTAGLAIAEQLSIAPERWVYVGDTRVDMLTGRAQGMCTVGVTWGFREAQELRESGAHHIIHKPADLLALLDARPEPAVRRPAP